MRLRHTLTARGPWLVALAFAMYASQWVSVIGFLPSIYRQAGYPVSLTALLTALAAAVNIAGNVASGRLLARGIPPQYLMYTGFVVMALMSAVAFVPIPSSLISSGSWESQAPMLTAIRYLAVLAFSLVGGMIPGTLFSMAVLLAPARDAVSTTVGWMQQWSAIGQFSGPPLVAFVASAAGGWQWTWLVTGTCSVVGLGLAWQIGQRAGRLQNE
jgi:cyanate permease